MSDDTVKPEAPYFTLEEATALIRVLKRSDFTIRCADLHPFVSALSKLQLIGEFLDARTREKP